MAGMTITEKILAKHAKKNAVQPGENIGELDPVHLRHDDVAEDEIEALATAEQLDRLTGAIDCNRRVAELLQRGDRDIRDCLIILDQEDAPALHRRLQRIAHADRKLRRHGGARQIERHRRAAPRRAVDLHRTLRFAGEAVDLRKPQPGALADGFRGEEGLEDARQDLRCDPASGITDSERDKLALQAVAQMGGAACA